MTEAELIAQLRALVKKFSRLLDKAEAETDKELAEMDAEEQGL
jgi:hypothetical protein